MTAAPGQSYTGNSTVPGPTEVCRHGLPLHNVTGPNILFDRWPRRLERTPLRDLDERMGS